jgi:hypothetical protein
MSRTTRPLRIARGTVRCLARATCGVLLLTALAACRQPPKVDLSQPPDVIPEYHELAQRYNANIKKLDRMWARASVRLFYRDQRGRLKSESGEDSLLMIEPPHRVALSLGKLGKTGVWAGCNRDQYWLFDVIESRTVWYGHTANLHRARDFPLPVHPQRLIALLGATPIEPHVATEHQTVRWDQGFFVIESPESGLRIWLEPRSAMPRQVSLLDERGEWRVVAKLTGEMRVEQADVPREQWPRLSSRAEIRIRDEEGAFTLSLRDATDGRSNPRIDRALQNAFDFASLLSALKPQEAINLDE